MTPPPEPARPDGTGPDTLDAGALALATTLVGTAAYVATWLLWHANPPVSLEAGALWTTVLLLGLPLVGVYALTGVEIVALGWRRGDTERAVKYAFGAVVAALPFIIAAGFLPGWPGMWPHGGATDGAYGAAGVYGAPGVALTLAWRAFVVEWFFRGFLLFGLLRHIGARAILAQMAVFGLLYLGAPWPLAVAAWPAGFVFGLMAWRCGSFLPAAAVHIIVALLLQLIGVIATSVG